MQIHTIIGIDVASQKLDLCVQHPDGTTVSDCIEYTIDVLQQWIDAHPECTPETCLIGMESTGDYHLKAAKLFLSHGYQVMILNPILTSRFTKATIRACKTDTVDAQRICTLIAEGHGERYTMDHLQDRRKELLRLARSLKKNKQQLTLRLQSTKRKDLDTKHIEESIEAIMELLDDVAQELVDEVTAHQTRTEEIVDSIPGFAAHLSAVVCSELGDMKRFHTAKSLVAYSGLDPRIKQSGSSLHTTGRITKRGSPHLRCALYLAANVACRFEPELAEYYQKKRSEGRTHKEVLCMVARKLLYRIWACVQEDREYVVPTT